MGRISNQKHVIDKEISQPFASKEDDKFKNQTHWQLPPEGFIKVNTDGAFSSGISVWEQTHTIQINNIK